MEANSLYKQYKDVIERILKLAIQGKRNPESKTITNAIEELQKIILVMESLKSFLQTADPILFGTNNKSNLQSYLNSIESNLQTYNSSPASYPAILDTIYSNYLEPTLNIFSYLIPKPTPNGLDYLSGAIVSARRSASQQLRHLNSEFEKKLTDLEARYSEKHVEINSIYEERLSTFETTLNEKQEAFDESLSDSTQLVENLKQLSAETTDDIKSQKTRLDTAIAEFQEQFSKRIGEYQKQFSEAEEDRRKKLESSIQNREKAYKKETTDRTNELNTWRDNFASVFDKDKKTFDETSQKLIEKVREYAQEAKVTVGLISEKSLQNDFIIQADNEKKRAWWWNLATFIEVGLLISAVGFIFVHTIIVPLPVDQANYPQILSKFLVTAVIGIIARWTSRQANRHLAEERRLRKLALELATINPFLNNLPDEIKHKVKEILAMRYYGNSSDEKAPFGEMTPIHDGDSGIKSVPEAILDNFRGNK